MDLEKKSRLLKKLLPKVVPQELLDNPRSGLASMGVTESAGLEATAKGLEKIRSQETLETTEANGLEAIIHEQFRPASFVINDDFHKPSAPWEHLAESENKERIKAAIVSIGRIELPGNTLRKYAGTGFVVGPNLIMTNRHVAEIFARGLGRRELAFKPNMSSEINFRREQWPCNCESLAVQRVVMIHPFWDMAILQVDGLGKQERKPLSLAVSHPDELSEKDIVVIGYPAQDLRNNLDLQNRIFGGVYDVKRLQPGKLRERREIDSFENRVNAITHDASTLGGNSGSAVIDIQTGEVVALHFAGLYLDANFAVPTYELARDSRVVDTGVNFAKSVEPTSAWAERWRLADLPHESATSVTTSNFASQTPPSQSVSFNAQDNSVTWTIPLTVKVTLGIPVMSTGGAGNAAYTAKEGLFSGATNNQQIVAKAYSQASISSLASAKFDWKAALMTCAASHLVYSDESRVIGVCKNDWSFDTCEFIQVNDTECFVASTASEVLLTFRGTADIKDWLRDLTLFSIHTEYGSVHRGFYEGFQQARKKIVLELEKTKAKNKRLVITGHSLGGALATIGAAELHHEFAITAVYTFGQPAVGKRDFESFMHRFSTRFHRVVNDDDIITKVPPGYEHCGKSIRFGYLGSVEATTAEVRSTMLSEEEFRSIQQSIVLSQNTETVPCGQEGFLPIPSISDHSLARYLAKIMEQTLSTSTVSGDQ